MERHNRFFAEDLCSETVALSVAESHHAMHVLRMRSGDAVELFDGCGQVADGRIAETRRGRVSVRVMSRRQAPARPRPVIHLAFAVPKGKRLDWLLEKASELAVASLTPVSLEHSVVEPGELAGSKRERWVGHCTAAAKQSGLNWLPELREPLALPEFLRRFDKTGAAGLAGSASPKAVSVREALAFWSSREAGEVHLLVGPEGGMTDSEYAAAEEAGFVQARIGSTTLRVETACVAMVSAVTALLEA